MFLILEFVLISSQTGGTHYDWLLYLLSLLLSLSFCNLFIEETVISLVASDGLNFDDGIRVMFNFFFFSYILSTGS